MPLRVRVPRIASPAAPSATTAWIKVAGVWKQATVHIKVAGVWKQATSYVKIGGTFK